MIKYHLLVHRNRPDERCHFIIEAYDGKTLAGRLTIATQDDTLGHAMDEGPGLDDGYSGTPGVNFAWLERLEVVTAYRRMGIGRVMVEKAARRLGRMGFEWLYLSAYPLDKVSFEMVIRFYRACGFKIDRRSDNGGKLMSRLLYDYRE